jgi:hypothetical protein
LSFDTNFEKLLHRICSVLGLVLNGL